MRLQQQWRRNQDRYSRQTTEARRATGNEHTALVIGPVELEVCGTTVVEFSTSQLSIRSVLSLSAVVGTVVRKYLHIHSLDNTKEKAFTSWSAQLE